MKEKKTVFLTGATGAMGTATLRHLMALNERPHIKVLARNSRKNHKLLDTLVTQGRVEVVWGDLTCYEDVKRGVEGADYVFHVGGMVSPAADAFPERTMKVNTESCLNIVRAIKAEPNPDVVRLVYIGSVAQLGNREAPLHWGRAGDPVWGAKYDYYALSKIAGERIIAESGLRHWVSLRQSGMLAMNLLAKATDPITFHVPLNGVLEWSTDDDSGRLLAKIVTTDLPEKFWRNFYNISSGPSYRLTNYEFEVLILKVMSCPPPEKIFESEWFATRNFHGQWYADSDLLEEYLHFRSGRTVQEYFEDFKKQLPFYFPMARIVPASVMKAFMKFVAHKKPLGPLYWLTGADPDRVNAYFGSMEEQKALPSWKEWKHQRPSDEVVILNHGYDESKPESELNLDDMRRAAEFRGGKCLAESMTPGDLDTPLEWECHAGHRFTATPRLVLKGGHWCPECFSEPWPYEEEARHNPFFAQVWKW